MLEFLNQYFASSPFIPHGHCYLWKPGLVWLNLLSDSLIALAYYSIPVMLIYFIRQRRDVPFSGIFWMFGAFIAACGTSHILEVWTLWHPIYWVSGTVKAFTAFISLYTATELFELIPQALSLPSPEQLQQANDRLSAEIHEKEKAQAEILILNAELEKRVEERTTQLQISNGLKEQALLSERRAREEAESSQLQVQNFASRLTLAMEAAKMGSWDWQIETGEIFWTPFHEIIFGYEPGRGKYSYEEWRERIYPEDLGKIEADLEKAREERNNYQGEYRVIRPDNTIRWVFSLGRFLYGEDGTAGRMVGMSIDITDRKENESALRESQRFIGRIAETTPGLLYIYDLKLNRNIYVNGQVSTILGYDQEYIEGICLTELLNLFDPEDAAKRPDFLRRLELSGDNEVHSFEYRFLCGDGQWRWLCTYETVFGRDGEGKPQQILGIALDVSQRKFTEIALYQANERYQLATAAVNCLIYDVDLLGRTVERTAAMVDIVGYTPEEAPISIDWWSSMIHPDDVDALLQRFREHIETIDRYCEEYRVRHKCGDYRWVRDQGLLVRDGSGNAIRMVGSTTDITAAKEAQLELEEQERELRQLTELLKKRNQDLDGFAYIVSHDLKAPLRAIAHLSEWIEEDLGGVLSEDNREQMKLLRQRVYRMENLINGLLDYSRVGRTELVAENVNVESLLAEIIDSLAPPDSFEICILKPLPSFPAKRLLLSQVFANLIGNAIKHHDRADGKITISGERDGNFYRFTVADDGPGIPGQYHGKIFGIFQTLKGQENNESTGIGLSIVKKIIETEGGVIELASVMGEGTSFRFTWPETPRLEED